MKMFLTLLLVSFGLNVNLAEAQSIGYRLSWSYRGPHPAVSYQRARMMDLKYRQSKAAWHREAREQRRNDLKERLRQKLIAYRRATQNRREQSLRQTKQYAPRIDRTKGVIDWPDRISTEYGDQTSQLDVLFQVWASGKGGLGSTNYSDIIHGCDELIRSMKHDLRQKRFKAPEYIYLKHFVAELRLTAGRSPEASFVAKNR